MSLFDQTKYLIKRTGLKPNKLKGQNFCVDEGVIAEMVKAAQITKEDTVLEVGAGFGFLTVELLKKVKEVIAVEAEPALVRILKRLESTHNNLEVVEGDILKISNFQFSISKEFSMNQFLNRLKIKNYKIVANLPYSITSAFLRKFLTSENKPESMTLLIQKEVAERICSGPGQISLLAVSVQLYSQPIIVKIVSPKSFFPKPQVESAILQITDIHNFPFKNQVSEKKFWQVVRAGFCAKRKTLENNLANSFHQSKQAIREILEKANLKPTVRAQELTINNWVKLTMLFA